MLLRNLFAVTLGALFGGLLCAAPADDADAVNIESAKDHVDFRIGKELITTYHIGTDVAKPFFWPLNAPGGAPLTRAWPMDANSKETKDHIHQKSAWFCHGDVIPEGIEVKDKIKGVRGVDFWSEAPGHGVIACIDVGKPKTAKGHAWITTRNEWRMADNMKILDETRTIHLYDLDGARLLVLDIDLDASVCLITFGDTKEGAFGVRIRDSLNEKDGKGLLENAEGKKTEKECWGRQSKWCDYAGKIDDKTFGLTLLDDPTNPYPACWHSRGYGLSAANPFGRAGSGFPAVQDKNDLVKLAKGDHLKLRYGLLLHAGNAKNGKVEECFERFVKLGKSE
ncbi:MAG TPA: PmoA family protein [Gemmataceae bacterium]|jgi:hypothetical protein